jgi:hypothetical protein
MPLPKGKIDWRGNQALALGAALSHGHDVGFRTDVIFLVDDGQLERAAELARQAAHEGLRSALVALDHTSLVDVKWPPGIAV